MSQAVYSSVRVGRLTSSAGHCVGIIDKWLRAERAYMLPSGLRAALLRATTKLRSPDDDVLKYAGLMRWRMGANDVLYPRVYPVWRCVRS